MEGAAQGLPPKSTVHDYLELWNWDGTLERIHHALYVAQREEEGREASRRWRSSLADREGRSKRGSWLDPSGYDAGKKIKGRKRHILVDTLGLVERCRSSRRYSGPGWRFHLLRRARQLFPFIERIFADGGYAGRKMAMTVWRTGAWSLQIVKRSDAAGFEVLPKRWIVERTLCGSVVTVAWLATSNATQDSCCIHLLAMISIMLGDLLQMLINKLRLSRETTPRHRAVQNRI